MLAEPQSIIVYRNPAEAALWESGLIFPLIIACVLSICAAMLVNKVLPWNYKYSGHLSMLAAAVVGVLTIWVMAF